MNYYPPVGFFFRVEFKDVAGVAEKSIDTNFQEVTGLTAELETEKYQEGGVNEYQHPLPKPAKFPNLSLKRGLLVDSKLADWVHKAVDQFVIEPKNLTVILMNEKGEPLVSWEVTNAFPVKWEVSGFNAMDNSIVVESIDLTYRKFTRSVQGETLKRK